MADPLSAGFAAAMSGAAALFTYNKDAFVFEKTLKQAEVHQRQNMRVQEVALYREDIRDLFGLTTQKMDNYLIVNTLMLGFCISLLYASDLPSTTPDWINWMWILSMCGSILFLLLSIWLCLHASITAQSLVVRLLTQWLRLPVPNAREISKYAVDFRTYEKSAKNLLRMPMISASQQSKRRAASGIPDDTEDPATVFLGDVRPPGGDQYSIPRDVFHGIGDLASHKLQKTHLHLFRELTMSWRGYDAYARVCMIMGTNQLLQALGHLSIAKMFLAHQQMMASLFVVITMHSLTLMHFKLNINPSRRQHSMMLIFLGFPPIATFLASSFWFYGMQVTADTIAIFAVLIHLIWIAFVLTLAIEDDGGMPKNFTQVGLSTDIVGDDNFADYIDDKLEKIRAATAVNVGSTTGNADDGRPSGNADTVLPTSTDPHRTEISVIDPLELIAKRLHKLMRQWTNVIDGNLILTPAEAHVRKRKVSRRFQKLCDYVRELPIDETTTDELADELRLLLDVKWNRVNSEYFINIDTGEIRVPGGQSDTAGSTRVEKFMESINRFREHDHGDDHDDGGDDSSDGSDAVAPTATATAVASDHIVIRVGGSSEDDVASFNGYDEEDETKSLMFDDSRKTNKLLKKQSTRPWTSYKQGSALLIFCWFVALINACLLPFDIAIKVPAGVQRSSHSTWNQGPELPGSDAGMTSAHIAARMNRVGRP